MRKYISITPYHGDESKNRVIVNVFRLKDIFNLRKGLPTSEVFDYIKNNVGDLKIPIGQGYHIVLDDWVYHDGINFSARLTIYSPTGRKCDPTSKKWRVYYEKMEEDTCGGY